MKTLDFHVHLGESIFGYGQSPEQLILSLDAQQIDRAVIMPVQPKDYHLGPQNDLVAETVSQHPERLIGFGRVDPRQDSAATEVRRCVENLGLKGIFLHPWEETYRINSDWVKALMPTIQALGVPVLIAGGHVRVSMASQLADLAKAFPTVPMVITSGGQINISGIALKDATQLLKEHGNLYLETSGIYREDFIEDLVPVIGSERMLFGSNSPEYHLGLEVLRPRMAHLGDEHKANLLYYTAAKLLKL